MLENTFLRIDDKIKRRVEEIAVKERRSLTKQVEVILADYIRRKESSKG